MSRITVVSDDDSIDAQTCAYAEYRLFAVIARHGGHVREVRVTLDRQVEPGRCDGGGCTVTVALEPSGSLTIGATGSHMYAAINRAVERLATALERGVGDGLLS